MAWYLRELRDDLAVQLVLRCDARSCTVTVLERLSLTTLTTEGAAFSSLGFD
jgi:hypothetical protein